ncbi:uncharacterized protein PGTG_05312 [Puccinia graminis f. sp. tritici CRL 75-36-700-3]|uniref:Uncharacterized protein n=2 Tax=Puccinia graminis f. sp. tritici TaxID=56615 RepID=E3K711_PUCGT|nr:uncharacterized protein PGTG_05312 [Puccinia graminis f. sp. tritici CRL 75-36-700-3]EFP80087.1 hypothetical protein PGTG_05312 [Puccinia graminis f. sp. tritici CRL 75-36-700-3]
MSSPISSSVDPATKSSHQAEARTQTRYQSPGDLDVEIANLLPYSVLLTLTHSRVQVMAENLELLTLEAIPTCFFALEKLATTILHSLQFGATSVELSHQELFNMQINPFVPFEDALSMLRGQTFANLNKSPLENRISILVRDVVDTQEGIEELAGTCLPQHFDSLERTLAHIQGIIARPQLIQVLHTGAGKQTHTETASPPIPHPTGELLRTHRASTVSTVPRAQSLVFFSQELNSAIFNTATSTIFKFADVLGGISPHEMELVLSAPTSGAGTYEEKLAKLTALENELIRDIISTMDPTRLVTDAEEFQGRVERHVQSHEPYCDLQSDLMFMRTQSVISSQQNFVNPPPDLPQTSENLHPAEATYAPAKAHSSPPVIQSEVTEAAIIRTPPLASIDPTKRSDPNNDGDTNYKRTEF